MEIAPLEISGTQGATGPLPQPMTIAALSGFAVSHLLKVPLQLWTVVTAVVLDLGDFRQLCEGDHRLSDGHARRRCVCSGRRNTGSPFK